MKKLPLKLVLEIDSTNLSTRRKGLEEVLRLMNETSHLQPKRKQVIWDKEFSEPYWKVKVVDIQNYLPERKTKKPRA